MYWYKENSYKNLSPKDTAAVELKISNFTGYAFMLQHNPLLYTLAGSELTKQVGTLMIQHLLHFCKGKHEAH